MEPTGNETILVVDDEPSLIQMLDTVLSHYGYKLLQANNADQALKMLSLNKIDLVISDVAMPGMDGHKLMDKIHQDFPGIKVQLVSGYNTNTDENTVLHKKILYRPFSNNEMLARIRELLDE